MAFEIPILDQSAVTGSTNFLQHRVVRISASASGMPVVVHTTGASTAGNLRAFGVSQNAPTASTSSTGSIVSIRTLGVTKVEASSGAITMGAWVRATSGAVASTSRLGGTVKATTDFKSRIGMALSSAAAGTGKRLVSVDLRF